MKIRQGMTSGECVENKWFNMKYIGKYLSVEILYFWPTSVDNNMNTENICNGS
jgi:hypothetical protein